jgi:Tfp pilus assembly protein PilZ
MASGFGSEQRRHPRVAPPKVVLRIPSVDRFREYYLKDLSQGGIFIKAEKLRSVGSELSLELWPPGWKEPLVLAAKVVRTIDPEQAEATHQTAGMAVAFLPATPEIEQQLQWLVAEHQEAGESAGDSALEEEASGDLVVEGLQESLASAKSELAETRGQLEAYAEQAKTLEEENVELRVQTKAMEDEGAELREQIAQLGEALEAQRERATALSASVLSEELEEVVGDEEPPVLVASENSNEDLALEVDSSLLQEEPADEPPEDHAGDQAKPESLHELGLELNFEPDDLVDLTAGSAPSGEEGAPDALDLLVDPDAEELNSEELIEEAPQNAPEPQDEELKALAAFNASLTPKTRLMPGGSLTGYHSEYEDEALLADLLGAAPTFTTLLSQTEGKIEEDTLRLLLQRFQRKGLVSLRN